MYRIVRCNTEDNNSVNLKNKNTNLDKNFDQTLCSNSSNSNNDTTFVINNNVNTDDGLNGDVVLDFTGVVRNFEPVSIATAIAELEITNIESAQRVLLFATICWLSDTQDIANPQFQIIRNDDFANPIYVVADTGDDIDEQSPTTTTFQFLDENPPSGTVTYKLVVNPTGETITACADAVFTAFKLK